MNNDVQLDSLIKTMAQGHQPELPSPEVIWWRAEIQKKLAEKERIERPMLIMRQVAAAICLVLLDVWLAANWGELQTLGTGRTWFLMFLALSGMAGAAIAMALLWFPVRRT